MNFLKKNQLKFLYFKKKSYLCTVLNKYICSTFIFTLQMNSEKNSSIYQKITALLPYFMKVKNWLSVQKPWVKITASSLSVLIMLLLTVLFVIFLSGCSLTSKIQIEQSQGDQQQKTIIEQNGNAQPLTLIINPLTQNHYASSSSFSSRS